MSPSRPYLLNALYEWILDNNCTPYVAVNASYEGTIVPQEYVRGGQIILDINPSAVHKFAIGKEDMQFSARFGGVSRQLYVPIPAITAIYAKETGAGMVFPINEYDDATPESGASEGLRDVSNDKEGLKEVTNDKEGPSGSGSAPSGGKSSGKKPNLRIVK
jgi:stringent starvation protein B